MRAGADEANTRTCLRTGDDRAYAGQFFFCTDRAYRDDGALIKHVEFDARLRHLSVSRSTCSRMGARLEICDAGFGILGIRWHDACWRSDSHS
jgi:hypothetical protein